MTVARVRLSVALGALFAVTLGGASAAVAHNTPARAVLQQGETLAIGGVTKDPGYPLDALPRTIAPKGKVRCPKVAKVRYRGDVIRYHSPVLVYVHFKARLRKFEEVVRQTAIDVYGRAPVKIRHIGTYNCRRISLWPTFLSEHGIANGIDVAGFDFGRLPRKASKALKARTPKRLRRPFKVRMLKHWSARKGVAKSHHSRFLRLLAARLIQRRDIFRVLLGPAYPGHKNHFHFDVSPWRLVQI